MTDSRLARRAAKGDQRALAAIYQRYHQGLYRFCFSIVGNAEDAQDALQNAMVKVMRSLPGEQRQIQLKPWLYRIAHNESIDLLRKRRDEPRIDPELVATTGGPEQAAASRERLRLLLADLSELPERQREALVMRELGGLDFTEIGAAFETSATVARQTVYEARLNLYRMETGREMSCNQVMQQISDADGRVLRRRDIQAHLRSCAECGGFRDAIEGRQRDLTAIAPLPTIASAGILHGLLAGAGGSGVGGAGVAGTAGAGAGKVVASSFVLKSVATVAVVATVGVGAADRGGLIDAGLPGGGTGQTQEAPLQQAPTQVETTGTGRAPVSREQASTKQSSEAERGSDRPTAEKGASQGSVPNAATGTPPSADPAPSSLPAEAKHGQEIAATHGGGRTHGKTRSQAKGHSKNSQAAHENPEHPTNSARGPKPSSSKPPKPKPGQVGPDVSGKPPFKPSQPPKSQGATGAAGGPSSKEAR